jgi:hypothetical protein
MLGGDFDLDYFKTHLNFGQANAVAFKLDLIGQAKFVERFSGSRANRPLLTASAIGLAVGGPHFLYQVL